jgi:TonB family protein
MPEAWKQWEGQVVNGEFPLLQYLGGSEHSAVFLTERHEGEHSQRAAIKLIPSVGEDSELRLSRWRLAAALSHPHLIPLFEMGRSEICNVPLLYVVMECAEENLAQVLLSRALNTAEARAMLEPVLDVLAYLHDKGFVHGRIKPADIMAIGEQVKVSSDELCRTGESVDGPGRPGAYDPPEYSRGVIPVAESISPAGDVWSLGMALIETLTQNLPDVRAAGNYDLLPSLALPEPFLDIVRHCLVWDPPGRWTIAEIAARLQNPTPLPQPRTSVRRPQPAERPQGPRTKWSSYAVPLAVGLLLAAILVGPRLFRRHSEAPQISAGAIEQPTIQNTQERPIIASVPNATEEREDSTRSATATASVHPDIPHEGGAIAGAKLTAAPLVRGEAVQQVLPDVLQSATDSIRGTVRVSVRVDVDREGNVEGAELVSPGASKYFARLAFQAAQRWKFKPPNVAGGSVLSTWTLRFDFTRAGTTVVPTQEIP